jgi:thioredoxin reductase (NADPH)
VASRHRRLEIADANRYLGVGIYFAATPTEAKRCKEEEVIVVGGGNSAGQAAAFLASGARHVHLLVRSNTLSQHVAILTAKNRVGRQYYYAYEY